ncbi:hypothetical protein [Bacillus toyonensis]|uniref:hypothetical protein n=1 Tax=Bacillus toyonensis TaxID=155322 RepID=UPI00027BEA4E|nr:hypothetical protein [Bacillus toyonensis]EJV41746.1 hypothetical protein IEA_05631 [Bacillus toyonensis]
MWTDNVKKRLTNWKTIVSIVSLVGFIFTKAGLLEYKNFLDELMPYIYTVGIALGIWSDHDEKPKGDVE